MARKLNLYADSGADYEKTLDAKRDLTGYSVNANLKEWTSYGNNVAFSTTISGNNVTITLTAADTVNLGGKYLYDVMIESGTNIKTKIYEGWIDISENIST